MTETRVIVIAGPTAAGKTAFGVSLAKKLGGEVVSADSVQLYRQFLIGAATPTAKEMQGVPHHLLGTLDSHVIYSASDYAQAADNAIQGVVERGNVPIVVGGSGLYLRALLFGLSESPGRDDELRETLYEQADDKGLDALYDELLQVDPTYAAKIHHNDRVRIVRALEVFRLTGEPLSEHHAAHDDHDARYDIAGIGLSMDREALHHRINKRTDEMLESGLLREVEELLASGVHPECQPMQSIGYREASSFLRRRGEAGANMPDAGDAPAQTLDELATSIATNTRRFAKRQLVWFRKDRWLRWHDTRYISREEDEIVEALHRFVDVGAPYLLGIEDERTLSATT